MGSIRQGQANHKWVFGAGAGARRLRRWRAIPLGCLLAGALLAGLAPAASAAPYEIRGEWLLTIAPHAHQTLHGTALINKLEENGEFSGTIRLESLPGTISGTISGEETSIKAAVKAPQGLVTFVAEKAVVKPSENKVSGSGELYLNGQPVEPATATAVMVKTYKEVQEREAKERQEREEREAREKKEREEREVKEAKERQEREIREAKEKKEKEEQEIRERPAREQKERELKEQQERELKEKALKEQQEQELKEREAKEKQAREQKERELKEQQERGAREAAERAGAGGAALLSIEPTGRTLTVSNRGMISLGLANPNSFSAHGSLKLTITTKASRRAAAHAAASGVKNATLAGAAAFSISGHATEVVKLHLSRSELAALTHRRTIPVLITITTQGTGQPDTSKTYSLTLRTSAAGRHKH